MAKQRKPVRSRAAIAPADRLGRRPSHSIILLYIESGGPVCGLLLAPATPKPGTILSGNGLHEVLGKWRDKGYLLGHLKVDPPAWARTHLPPHSQILGFAVVTGVSQQQKDR